MGNLPSIMSIVTVCTIGKFLVLTVLKESFFIRKKTFAKTVKRMAKLQNVMGILNRSGL